MESQQGVQQSQDPTSSVRTGPVGLALGSFDGVHRGHLSALSAAVDSCGQLVIAVADDGLVQRRCGAAPLVAVAERIELLEAFFPTARIEAVETADLADLVERFDVTNVFVAGDPNDHPELAGTGAGVTVVGVQHRPTTSTALRALDDEVLWAPR